MAATTVFGLADTDLSFISTSGLSGGGGDDGRVELERSDVATDRDAAGYRDACVVQYATSNIDVTLPPSFELGV
jgi:hypothetical protein